MIKKPNHSKWHLAFEFSEDNNSVIFSFLTVVQIDFNLAFVGNLQLILDTIQDPNQAEHTYVPYLSAYIFLMRPMGLNCLDLSL